MNAYKFSWLHVVLVLLSNMIIPVRCFTCGKVIANKWNYYKQRVDELEQAHIEKMKSNQGKENDGENYKNFDPVYKKQILDELGLTKLCCRRHLLTHVDLVDII